MLKTQRLSLLPKRKKWQRLSPTVLDCDELEEDEAVIDDDKHTHQIELATLATYFTKSHSVSSKFDFCDNGNRGLRSVL